ncbi:MAG: HD domain-containing protein, partial [Eubacterium sp.]|nr:HD domain-containing protein [Eubacterium sp.]
FCGVLRCARGPPELRPAATPDYVVHQITVNPGRDAVVIDDSTEKNYIDMLMFNMLPKKHSGSAVVIHLGSGNIFISLLEDACLTYTTTMKTGGLRLSEMFEVISAEKFTGVIKEYLKPFIDGILSALPETVGEVILTGYDVGLISRLCGGKVVDKVIEINKEGFTAFYKQTKESSLTELSERYKIDIEKQEIIMPALVIYNRILKHVKANKIMAMPITAGEALLVKHLNPSVYKGLEERLEENAVVAAWRIAERYQLDIEHTKEVERCALLFFDRLKKIHGLGKRERFLLSLTAILHNTGKFINHKAHYIHSYNIIRGLDITGINGEEREIIANAALFHGSLTPDMQYRSYSDLSQSSRAVCSKLCAILRLATAVNVGYGKYQNVNVKLKANEFIITLDTYKDIDLEKLIFSKKSKLFADVYGIKAVLKKRSVI